MNLLVIASPDGDIVRVSGLLPGSVHDKKAEWIWGIPAELEAAGLFVLADKGYQGATHAKVPYRGRTSPNPRKTPTAPTRNSGHPASARTPGSRPGASSASSAAAPAAPDSSPRPSTDCRSARQTQDEKGSVYPSREPARGCLACAASNGVDSGCPTSRSSTLRSSEATTPPKPYLFNYAHDTRVRVAYLALSCHSEKQFPAQFD